MRIWVDADACPGVTKEILFRAAVRTGIPLTLVANRPVWIPRSSCISFLQVSSGADVADNEIVRKLAAGDLVVTSDIPLAANVVAEDGVALDPRGELYTEENIRSRLSMRDFMDDLRGAGVETGGPAKLSQRDRQTFANHLDTILSRYLQNS